VASRWAAVAVVAVRRERGRHLDQPEGRLSQSDAAREVRERQSCASTESSSNTIRNLREAPSLTPLSPSPSFASLSAQTPSLSPSPPTPPHPHTMHCFVRDLSGRSLPFSADSVSSLSSSLSARTGVPETDFRLTYGSHQLLPSETLDEAGVSEGATVGMTMRLKGGAPKKRCAGMLNGTERCSQAAVRIVGDCQLCKASFCGKHRLAEGAFSSLAFPFFYF
jgi:hypothetical protein